MKGFPKSANSRKIRYPKAVAKSSGKSAKNYLSSFRKPVDTVHGYLRLLGTFS
jgi:hypothetical protein